jgi:hypothetical protein
MPNLHIRFERNLIKYAKLLFNLVPRLFPLLNLGRGKGLGMRSLIILKKESLRNVFKELKFSNFFKNLNSNTKPKTQQILNFLHKPFFICQKNISLRIYIFILSYKSALFLI